MQELLNSKDDDVRQLEALEMSLAAFESNRPAPPAAPPVVWNTILSSLDDQLRPVARGLVKTSVEEIHQETQASLAGQDAQVRDLIREDLAQMLRGIEVIATRVKLSNAAHL